MSLRDIAAAADGSLVRCGQVTALAPRTMAVINTKPGNPSPFIDLNPEIAVLLLLSTFTPGQWQQVGSVDGIGAIDLDNRQRLLWAQILPIQAKVERIKAGTNKEPAFIDTHPRALGRLRLNKIVDLRFFSAGTHYASVAGDPYEERDTAGGTRYRYRFTLRGDKMSSPLSASNSAYGVPLILEKPRRRKPGALDFAAPALAVRISLRDFPKPPAAETLTASIPSLYPYESDFKQFVASQEFPAWAGALSELSSLPTVAVLLQKISMATGREFIADRRVRDLRVYLRGDTARVGDLLSALCDSVAGTFRQIEPGGGKDSKPLFLLTDDVRGIGARTAAIDEWAEAANNITRRLQSEADTATAATDPLDYLSFAPDDPLALSKAQVVRIEDSWRRRYDSLNGSPPTVLYKDMSPALQQAVNLFAIERRIKNNAPVRTDSAQVGEMLKASLILPEIPGTVVDLRGLERAIGRQYLQRIAFDPAKEPAAATLPPPGAGGTSPLAFALARKRQPRIVIAARPADAAQAVRIVEAASGHGFSAVWLEVNVGDAKSAVRLLTAAAEAGVGKISVGGVLYLLKGTNLPGQPERNVLGQTGEELQARRRLAGNPDNLDGFTGWVSPDPAAAAELRRRVTMIAKVPGLAALTFRATASPGVAGQRYRYDAGATTNTAFGYTAPMRRLFLREYSVDPIDIPEWIGYRNIGIREIRWNLGYFKESTKEKLSLSKGQGGAVASYSLSESPWYNWWQFRNQRSTMLLADMFRAVRKTRASLLLFIDDRRFDSGNETTHWYGSGTYPSGYQEPALVFPRA